jgi:peptide-methionine (S)-S-oxide reductase
VKALRLWISAFALVAGAAGAQTLPAKPAGATSLATFAGGCFWCVESDFDKVPGVLSTTSGYTGGKTPNPTYQQVSGKGTGHAEVVQIVFDPSKVSYEQLLEKYWHSIDPTTQGPPVLRQRAVAYRTAIFAHDDAQLAAARASLAALEKSKPFKEPIVTQIERLARPSTRPRTTTRTTTRRTRCATSTTAPAAAATRGWRSCGGRRRPEGCRMGHR